MGLNFNSGGLHALSKCIVVGTGSLDLIVETLARLYTSAIQESHSGFYRQCNCAQLGLSKVLLDFYFIAVSADCSSSCRVAWRVRPNLPLVLRDFIPAANAGR